MTEKREPVKAEDGQIRYRLTQYRYDADGNRTQERRFQEFQSETGTEGAVHTISFEYDKDNRRIRVSDSTGAVVEYRYNSRNLCTFEKRKFTEQLYQTFRYEYDAAGRIISTASSIDKP